jgi:hypothetical protein
VVRRGGGGADPAIFNATRDKIKRLEDKLKAGGLSPTEAATLTAQIASLKTSIATATRTLTSAEQADYDAIEGFLVPGKDVTFDEGEHRYELALAPFVASTGGGAAGGPQVTDPTPTTHGARLPIADVSTAMTEARNRGIAEAVKLRGIPATWAAYQGIVAACLGNDKPEWSDIVAHYYCQFAGVRECFTGTVDRLKSSGGAATAYADALTFCSKPIDPANPALGVNGKEPWAWLMADPKRFATFKYIMMGGGYSAPNGRDLWGQDDQDEAINKSYQVADPTNAAECAKRLKRNSSQETHASGGPCGKPYGSSAVGGGSGLGGAGGGGGAATLPSGPICGAPGSSPGTMRYQIAAPATPALKCHFRLIGATSWDDFSMGGAYDATTGRWSCADWMRGNPRYEIRLTLGTNEYMTDEPTALAHPCP